MLIIPLLTIPRQQFTTTLENVRFSLTFQAVGKCMYSTIVANGAPITNGVKCAYGFQLMPARWMEGVAGNFGFGTPDKEIPWWENFGTTHILYYVSAAELKLVRGGRASI